MCYVAGIDIGSAFSKAVIIEKNKIISYYVVSSGGNYKQTAEKVATEALTKAGLSFKDLVYTVATGYGSSNVSFSDQVVTDVSCQSMGTIFLFSSVRTVVDIGDMYTKVIKIDDKGRAISFLMSGKCAGGSARLLQVMSHVLHVDLNEIGELSLKSSRKIDFDTSCAVFAESEVISRIAEGDSKEDILAGVHQALAAQIQSLLERLGIEKACALVGGGAKDKGLIKCIEERLGLNLMVPDEPQITAALGAALIAEEKAASIKVECGLEKGG